MIGVSIWATMFQRAVADSLANMTAAASRTTVVEGQGVHFKAATVSPAALRHADFTWDFGADEDYAFASDVPAMRCAADARYARGQYAAHVFETTGTHTPTCAGSWQGETLVTASAPTITVQAVGTAYNAAATAVLAPTGESLTGAPAHDTAFTDLDTAMAWVVAASNRRLSIKRGHTYGWGGTTYFGPAEGMYIDAWGSGAKPIIGLASSARLWRLPVLEETGDAVQTVWSGISDITANGANAQVYLDNARQTTGFSWNAAGTEITFTTAPGSGVVIRVFNGYPQTQKRAVLKIQGTSSTTASDHVIRDLVFRGDYNPATPSEFDGDDLTTFDHDICWRPFEISSHVNDVTIFRCESYGNNGLNNSSPLEPSRNVFFVDCVCRDWFDYGIGVFVANINAFCCVGNDLRQNPLTVRQASELTDNNGSESNLVDRPNRAAHGPFRIAASEDCVVSRNVMFTRGSWFALAGGGDQPCARMAQGATPNQSLAATENTWIGGSSIFGMSPPNANVPYAPQREMVVAHNFIEVSDRTNFVGGAPYEHTFRSNIVHLPIDQTTGGGLELFSVQLTSPEGFCPAEALPPQPEVYGNTLVFAGSRATRPLTLGGPMVLQEAGIAGQRGLSATADGSSVVVIPDDPSSVNPKPASRPFYEYQSAWRVFVDGVALANTLDEATARYTVEELTGPLRLRVTFASGFEPPMGAQVALAWNPSYRSSDYPERAGEFYENGLATARVRAAPKAFDNVTVVDGSFGTLTDYDGVTALNVNGYRANTLGTTDLRLRPTAGNTTLAKRAGTRLNYSDYMAQAAAEPAFQGAMQPTTPLRDGFPDLVEPIPSYYAEWLYNRQSVGAGTYGSINLLPGSQSSSAGMIAFRFRFFPAVAVQRILYAAGWELRTKADGLEMWYKAGSSGGIIDTTLDFVEGVPADHSIIIAWDSAGGLPGGATSLIWIDGTVEHSTTAALTSSDISSLTLCGLNATSDPAEMGVRSWFWLSQDACPDLTTAAAAFFDADDSYEPRDLGPAGVVDGVTPTVYLLGRDSFNGRRQLGDGPKQTNTGSPWYSTRGVANGGTGYMRMTGNLETANSFLLYLEVSTPAADGNVNAIINSNHCVLVIRRAAEGAGLDMSIAQGQVGVPPLDRPDMTAARRLKIMVAADKDGIAGGAKTAIVWVDGVKIWDTESAWTNNNFSNAYFGARSDGSWIPPSLTLHSPLWLAVGETRDPADVWDAFQQDLPANGAVDSPTGLILPKYFYQPTAAAIGGAINSGSGANQASFGSWSDV